MRKKALTTDCASCNHCSVSENSDFLCSWGKGKPKIMFSQKGKTPLKCKLIKKDKK